MGLLPIRRGFGRDRLQVGAGLLSVVLVRTIGAPDAVTVAAAPSLRGLQVVQHPPDDGAACALQIELPELQIATDAYEACAGADCVVIATAWNQFADLDLDRVRSILTHPILIDARNIFRQRDMAGLGFTYYPIGRPTATPVAPSPP